MGRNTQLYSQAKCSVIVAAADGSFQRVVTDFAGDNDAISFEPNEGRIKVQEGLDRSRLSVSAGTAGKVTLKLKPTSPECGLFNRLYKLHRSNPILLNISIYSGVEEVVKLQNCLGDLATASTGGAEMQTQSFTFIGEDFSPDESEG